VYWRDLPAGTIAKSVGRSDINKWSWNAGFYPGSRPGEVSGGIASSYDEAKARFIIAWLKFAHSRKPEDIKAYRELRDWTARKYTARNAGTTSSKARSETGAAHRAGVKCRTCEKPFSAKRWSARFCSARCRVAAHRAK
jgi:hypothetical protein